MIKTVSLAPNRFVPTGFKEENFHADGTFELISYNKVSLQRTARRSVLFGSQIAVFRSLKMRLLQWSWSWWQLDHLRPSSLTRAAGSQNAGPVFKKDGQDFETPLDEDFR